MAVASTVGGRKPNGVDTEAMPFFACVHNPTCEGTEPCSICFPRHEVPMRGMRVQAESTEVSGGFREAFEAVLGHTPRWEGFSLIVGDQLERERVGIIETGTCRKPGDWAGDGQSTRVWDWVLSRKPGVAVSVDVEMASVETAQKCCTRVHCVCQDSVTFLRGYIPFVPTLLYLDSRDWGPGAEVASCMQQVAELAACWERLPAGCLIASDDSHNLRQGKPTLSRQLLKVLGIEPILESYIVVWRKP